MEPAIARERAHSSAADIFRSPPPGRIEPGLASLVRLCAKPAWGAASRVSPNPAPLLPRMLGRPEAMRASGAVGAPEPPECEGVDRQRAEFAPDSPLEEAVFEPSVPQELSRANKICFHLTERSP
jgi:hypothetical protein